MSELGGGIIKRTVIVDKIRHTDTHKSRVKTGVKTCDSLSLNDAPGSIVSRCMRSFRLDLRTSG